MYFCNIFVYILACFIAPKGWFIAESQAAVPRTHGYPQGRAIDAYSVKLLTIDVNNKTSTNNLTYSYNRSNNSCTFTPRYPYRIEKVTNGKKVVWDAANYNFEYGSQLVGTLKDNGTYSYRVYFDKDMGRPDGQLRDDYYGVGRQGTYYDYNDPHYKSEYRRTYRDYEDPYYHSALQTYQDYDNPYQRHRYNYRYGRGYSSPYSFDSGSDYEYGGRRRLGHNRNYSYVSSANYRYGHRNHPYQSYGHAYRTGRGRYGRTIDYDFDSGSDYQYGRGRMAGRRGGHYRYDSGDEYRGRGRSYTYETDTDYEYGNRRGRYASGYDYRYGDSYSRYDSPYYTGRRAGRSEYLHGTGAAYYRGGNRAYGRHTTYGTGASYYRGGNRAYGRNISYDSEDDRRGGRHITYDSEDDRRGGRRYSLDSGDDRRGGRHISYDSEDDRRGRGRRYSLDSEDDRRGRHVSYDSEDDRRHGRRSGRRDYDYESASEGDLQRVSLDVNKTSSTREVDYYYDTVKRSHNFVPKAGYAIYQAKDYSDVIWSAKAGKYPSQLVVTRDRSGKPKLEVLYDTHARAGRYGTDSSVGGITLDVNAYWNQQFKDNYYTATSDGQFIKYAFKSNIRCVKVKCNNQHVWSQGECGMHVPKNVKYNKGMGEILISDGSTVLVYRVDAQRRWALYNTKSEDSFFKKLFSGWGSSKNEYDYYNSQNSRTIPYNDDDLYVDRSAAKRGDVSYFASSMSPSGRPSQFLTDRHINQIKKEERIARAKVMEYPDHLDDRDDDDDRDEYVNVSHQTRLGNAYSRANYNSYNSYNYGNNNYNFRTGTRHGVYRDQASGRLTQDIPLTDD